MITSNRALVDGNKWLAWAAATVFLWINGHDLDALEDGACELVIAVADAPHGEVCGFVE